jgi:GNAT superfamily N-acetyltransferase
VGFTVIRYSQRPELWEDTEAISREVWPEYNQHGAVVSRYWERLFDDFPDYRFALFDAAAQEVIAEGHTAPCDWDGTTEGLGDGIDTMMVAAFEARAAGRRPTALCALAAEVRPRFQGGGLADRILDVMSDVGRDAGLGHLIAPVRPSFKDRYPITPIERYLEWTRPGCGSRVTAYTFPDGLAPVEIDHERDRGSYWEPNVWIVHTLAA